eukprot:TRINITY_DN4368_c0_g1_i1.p2 TRINITY_DN4368_c0_g1~~TRINITY_DN4368_c0_g1_i1.p2  ORF type:complete len:137 (+),score=20.51 TRINITY_DN4368_c0_g1_i1:840-1250(+)
MGLTSAISGSLFAASWWVFIDGIVQAEPGTYDFVLWMPGLLGTLGFLMVNATSPSDFTAGNTFDETNVDRTKVWFFFSVLIAFLSIISAIWIMLDKESVKDTYSGTTVVMQGVLLLSSALVLWFGRAPKTDDDLGM